MESQSFTQQLFSCLKSIIKIPEQFGKPILIFKNKLNVSVVILCFYRQLWTDFMHCVSDFIIDVEKVNNNTTWQCLVLNFKITWYFEEQFIYILNCTQVYEQYYTRRCNLFWIREACRYKKKLERFIFWTSRIQSRTHFCSQF